MESALNRIVTVDPSLRVRTSLWSYTHEVVNLHEIRKVSHEYIGYNRSQCNTRVKCTVCQNEDFPM